MRSCRIEASSGRALRALVVSLGLVAGLVTVGLGAARGEEALVGSPDPTYAIGEKVDDALGKDLEGDAVRLSDLGITRAKAWAAVAKAADVFGAAGAAKPTTRFSDLAPLAAGSGVDETGKEALVGEAGRAFGLVATADRVKGMTTLGDVAAWIESCAKAPIVVVVWSPGCKVCRNGADEYLNGVVAETGARLVALAPGYGTVDTEDEIRAYLDAKPWFWRVVPDADRSLTERFGGTLTPHAFVVDAARVLRYRGALYEAREAEEAAERPAQREYLREAVAAVAAGRAVPTATTEPVGCPLPRAKP
jgi:hypothetical protein